MTIADFAPAKRSKGRISSRPSTLIRQVVHDIRRVLRMKSVRLGMDAWAKVNDAGQCEVCAAGALLLCRCARSGLRCNAICERPEMAQRVYDIMCAVDDLRLGHVRTFLLRCREAGHRISPQTIDDIMEDAPELDETLRLTAYPSNTEVRAWCMQALKLAKRLEAIGH